MAIRERKGRKALFMVYWRNPFTGALESKSVETRAEAEKLDAFVKYQLKYERESFRREEATTEKPKPQVQTLETVFYLYLRDRNFGVDSLGKTLSGMKTILAQFGDTEIHRVDKPLLADMLKTLTSTGLKGTTVQRRMGIVKAVLHWALENSYIDTLPLFPAMPKAECAKYVPPSAEEVQAIYEAAPPHLQRVIILGFMFGMRVGPCELLRLRWEDVDLQKGIIRVPNAKKGNTDPWREVPIRQSLLSCIQQWKSEDADKIPTDYVVTYNGKPVQHIRRAWHRALKKAGIQRHIRPYDLRHGFATEAIAAGADYGTVAALMGHRNPMMVLKHYQHVKSKQKQSVMESIPQPHFGV